MTVFYYFMALLATLGSIAAAWMAMAVVKEDLSVALRAFWVVVFSYATLTNIVLTIYFLWEAGFYG